MIYKSMEDRQLALALLGYYTLRYETPPRQGDLAIDRLKGPCITEAIRSFQQDSNLDPDGLWGPVTEEAVRDALKEGRKRPAPELPDNPSDIPSAVYTYLIGKGLSPAGACGIMGNVNAESAMRPNNLEDKYQRSLHHTDQSYTQAVDDGSYTNFGNDHAGYGLCQWTWSTRKKGLLAAAKAAGVSVSDLQLQLDYLWHELQTHWPSLITLLRDPSVTIWAATEQFMRQFEDPADKSTAAIQGRAEFSKMYFARFA